MSADDRNDDNCKDCRMGGFLACCEKCPAAYHPACVDALTSKPAASTVPTEDEGEEWLCPHCIHEILQDAIDAIAEDEEDWSEGRETKLGGPPLLKNQCPGCGLELHSSCSVVINDESDGWLCAQCCCVDRGRVAPRFRCGKSCDLIRGTNPVECSSCPKSYHHLCVGPFQSARSLALLRGRELAKRVASAVAVAATSGYPDLPWVCPTCLVAKRGRAALKALGSALKLAKASHPGGREQRCRQKGSPSKRPRRERDDETAAAAGSGDTFSSCSGWHSKAVRDERTLLMPYNAAPASATAAAAGAGDSESRSAAAVAGVVALRLGGKRLRVCDVQSSEPPQSPNAATTSSLLSPASPPRSEPPLSPAPPQGLNIEENACLSPSNGHSSAPTPPASGTRRTVPRREHLRKLRQLIRAQQRRLVRGQQALELQQQQFEQQLQAQQQQGLVQIQKALEAQQQRFQQQLQAQQQQGFAEFQQALESQQQSFQRQLQAQHKELGKTRIMLKSQLQQFQQQLQEQQQRVVSAQRALKSQQQSFERQLQQRQSDHQKRQQQLVAANQELRSALVAQEVKWDKEIKSLESKLGAQLLQQQQQQRKFEELAEAERQERAAREYTALLRQELHGNSVALEGGTAQPRSGPLVLDMQQAPMLQPRRRTGNRTFILEHAGFQAGTGPNSQQ